MRFNRYRKENGHLFQGRFKSLLVEPGKHWRDLVDYIHLNPVRAGLVPVSALRSCPWTSLHEFPKRKSRPGFLDCRWMDYDELLSDSPSGWRRYAGALSLKDEEDPEELEKLERRLCRGWCVGGKAFKEEVARELLGRPVAVRLEKEQLEELNRSQWEILLQALLAALGKGNSDIRPEKRAPAWKKAIVSRMRELSSVSSAWLGERLELGAGRRVNALCSYYERTAKRNCEWARLLSKITADGSEA